MISVRFRALGYTMLASVLLVGGTNHAQTCPAAGDPPTGNKPVLEATILDSQYGFPTAIAGIGDFDGDCYEDFIVGGSNLARIYFGGDPFDPATALELESPSGSIYFGWSVAGVGDFNGDGLSDVAVGQISGEVTLFFGSPDSNGTFDAVFGSDILVTGTFGWSVAGGDLNGDGLSDLVVGAPYYSDFIANGNTRGRVFVYYGKPNPWYEEPDVVLLGTGGWDRFGFSLAYLGDFDGDGYGDFAAGSPGAGKVSVFFGSASGVAGQPLDLSTSPSPPNFAGALAAGDANGDGLADVLVGGSDQQALYQKVALYLGRTDAQSLGQLTSADWDLVWGDYQEMFGQSVALEDVDGDGLDEAVVGSPGYAFNSGDQTYKGQVSLWRFTETAPYATYEGGLSGHQLGQQVAALGDINLDGINDLSVGTSAAHVVNLYLGAKPPCRTDMNGDGVMDLSDIGLFSTALSAQDPAADFNGDGEVDLTDIALFSTALAQGCP